MPKLFNYRNPGTISLEWSPAELGMASVDMKSAATTSSTSLLDLTGMSAFTAVVTNTQTGTPASGVMQLRFDVYAADGTTVIYPDLTVIQLTLGTTATTNQYFLSWGVGRPMRGALGGTSTGVAVATVTGLLSNSQEEAMRALGLVKLKTVVTVASTATTSVSSVYFRASTQ